MYRVKPAAADAMASSCSEMACVPPEALSVPHCCEAKVSMFHNVVVPSHGHHHMDVVFNERNGGMLERAEACAMAFAVCSTVEADLTGMHCWTVTRGSSLHRFVAFCKAVIWKALLVDVSLQWSSTESREAYKPSTPVYTQNSAVAQTICMHTRLLQLRGARVSPVELLGHWY